MNIIKPKIGETYIVRHIDFPNWFLLGKVIEFEIMDLEPKDLGTSVECWGPFIVGFDGLNELENPSVYDDTNRWSIQCVHYDGIAKRFYKRASPKEARWLEDCIFHNKIIPQISTPLEWFLKFENEYTKT